MRVLGILLVLVGAATTLSAVGFFRRARTSLVPIRPSTTLVSTGPYRFTRNPMYLGLAVVYVGIACWLGTLWPLLLLPVVLVLVGSLVIAREERYLEAKFGEEYRAYRARVRRWL